MAQLYLHRDPNPDYASDPARLIREKKHTSSDVERNESVLNAGLEGTRDSTIRYDGRCNG